MYHIDHCTDSECPGFYESHSANQKKKCGVYSILHENTMTLSIGSASSKNSWSIDDENDILSIDLRSLTPNRYDPSRPTSVKSGHVTVQKVPKIRSADSLHRKKTDENDNDLPSSRRVKSSGSIQVTRVKSFTETDPQTSLSSDLPRPSIVESTIHLSKTSETISSANSSHRINSGESIRVTRVKSSTENDTQTPAIDENSSKPKKSRARVQRVKSAHRTSAIESRPSQIDTIELRSVANESSNERILPPIRVQHLRADERKQLKSPKSLIQFEAIAEESTGVTVERIPRVNSTKSTKSDLSSS